MVPSLRVMTELKIHAYTALALAARVKALRQLLLAAFVTHPHPDHFNGLPYVAGEDVPVYATSLAAKTIEESAIAKREQWQPVYGEEWPDRFRVPDRLMDDDGPVDIVGLRIGVHNVGPAESHADSYLIAEAGGNRVAVAAELAA
jgi:glyoxylase-like metal-dependent hydrolase (beta-lactamase superfamily II)